MVMSRLKIPSFEDLLKKFRQPKIPVVSATVTPQETTTAMPQGLTLPTGWKAQPDPVKGLSFISPAGNTFTNIKVGADGKIADLSGALVNGKPLKFPTLPPVKPPVAKVPSDLGEQVRQGLKGFEVKRGNISASVTPSEIFPKPISSKDIAGPEPGFEKGYRTAEDIQRQLAIPRTLGVPELGPPTEQKLPGPRQGIGFALDILTGRQTTENPKGLTPIEYAQTIPLAEAAISGIPAAVTLGAVGYQGLKEATDLLLRASIMRNLSLQSAARGIDITKERAEVFANELTSALSRRFSMGQNWKNIFDFARGKYVPKPEAAQEAETMAREAVSQFLVPRGTQTGAMAFGGLPSAVKSEVLKTLPTIGQTNNLKALTEIGKKVGLDVEAVRGLGKDYWIAITAKPGARELTSDWLYTLPPDQIEKVKKVLAFGERELPKGKSLEKHLTIPFKSLEDAHKFLTTGDTSVIAHSITSKAPAWSPAKVARTEKLMQQTLPLEEKAKLFEQYKATQEKNTALVDKQIEAVKKQISKIESKFPQGRFGADYSRIDGDSLKKIDELNQQVRQLEMEKPSWTRFVVSSKEEINALMSGSKQAKAKPVVTPVSGDQIAKSLGIRFDGIQKGTANIPDKMQFTDTVTGSTTYGNTLEEVKANIDTMRAKFESAKPQPTAKEPSMMTKDEFEAQKLEELRNSKMWSQSSRVYKRTLEESIRKRSESEWLDANEQAYISGKDVPLSGRPDWSLTAEEVAYRSDDTLDSYIINEHDKSVAQAIQDGKPVPPEVVADYKSRQSPKPISVDDDVIFHSPFTNEDIVMNFRGYEGDKAVLFNKKSGMQIQVPKDQIKPMQPVSAKTPQNVPGTAVEIGKGKYQINDLRTGKPTIVSGKPAKIKGFEEYEFFVARPMGFEGKPSTSDWVIYEKTTGFTTGITGKTQSVAVSNAEKKLTEIGKQKLDEAIGKGLKPKVVQPAPLHQALIQDGEQLIQQAEKISPQDANLQSFKAAVEKAKSATDTETRVTALREMENLEPEVQKIGETKPTEQQPPVEPPPPAEPPVAETPPAPETPEDFAGNIRLSKYPEELRDTIKSWANEHPDEITNARRGVRSDAQVLEDAQRLVDDVGGDFKRLQAKWKSGDAWNAEEILALRGVLRAKTQAIIDAQKLVQIDSKLENLVKLNEAILAQAEVQEIVTGVTAEAGRALRQFRQDAFEATGDAAKLEKLLEKIGGKDKVKEISEALGQLDVNDPVAVNNFVRNILKPGMWDYVSEIYYNSILSGPKTHIVNSLSNTFNALVSPIERAAAAAIDVPLSKIQGRPRARFFNEVPADAFGAMEGSKEGLSAWWQTMKTSVSPEQATKYEIPRVRAFKGFLGRVINFPSTNLEAADSLMRQVNYRAVFNAVAKRIVDGAGNTGQDAVEALAELKTNPTKELLDEAAKVSEYRLFRAPAGKFTQNIIGMRGAVNIGGFKPLTFIVPFVRTPVNLLKYGLERSPAGWFNPKMWDNLKKAKPEAADQIGRVMLGTLMAAAIAIYVKEGLITGAAPANEAERDRFYRDGKQPFSVRIGDIWVSYQRLEPFNQAFSQVAAVMKAMQDKESDTASKIGQIVSTIGQNLVSQTYLSGLANTIDAIRQPERYGDDLLTRLATALAVPASSLTRTIAQLLDTTVREPRTLIEAIKAGIPGLSKQVPAKVTAFGEDVVRKSPAWSPVNISPAQETEITKELDRLEINTGFISGTIAGVVLTDMERREYQRVAGKLTAERITELIEAPSYNSLSDENKERAIERTVNEARDQARKLILGSISQEEQEARKRDGIPSKNSVMGGSTASNREAEKAIEDWQPDWRLKDEAYWNFTNNKKTYESLKKEDKPKWIKDNPAFVADQFLYGDRTDWKDGTYDMAIQVADRAKRLGVPLTDIPAFSLTDKGNERIPSDRKLWKPYFDYNDLPGSSYLAMSKEQVGAGLLPDKYLKEWQTYQSLKTDTAKDYFRKAHKEVSKGDWRDDFRRANPEFDKWVQENEGLKPLKKKTIAARRSSGSSIRPASGVSLGSSSIRRPSGKVSYPKFKKLSVKSGMSVGAPRAPGV